MKIVGEALRVREGIMPPKRGRLPSEVAVRRAIKISLADLRLKQATLRTQQRPCDAEALAALDADIAEAEEALRSVSTTSWTPVEYLRDVVEEFLAYPKLGFVFSPKKERDPPEQVATTRTMEVILRHVRDIVGVEDMSNDTIRYYLTRKRRPDLPRLHAWFVERL